MSTWRGNRSSVTDATGTGAPGRFLDLREWCVGACGDVRAGVPAGWYPDPLARHEYRYWDGARWTDQIADQGRSGVDPVSAPTGAAAARAVSVPAASAVGVGVPVPAQATGVTFVLKSYVPNLKDPNGRFVDPIQLSVSGSEVWIAGKRIPARSS